MIVTTDPDGEIRKTGDTYELVFRRRYAKPIEKVWAALTVPERIADWFTQVTFHPRVELGARIEVVFPETPDKIEPGEVIAFDPPRLLAWRWPFETRRHRALRARGGWRRLPPHLHPFASRHAPAA